VCTAASSKLRDADTDLKPGFVSCCPGGVRQLLGPLSLELALGAALSGADLLGQLLPGLAAALATGSLPADAAHSRYRLCGQVRPASHMTNELRAAAASAVHSQGYPLCVVLGFKA